MVTTRRDRLRRYGLTPDVYQQMLERRGGVCAICGLSNGQVKNLAVDHDHRCCPTPARSCGKCVRGLLCGSCNGSLGEYELAIKHCGRRDRMERFNDYIREHPVPGLPAAVPGLPGSVCRRTACQKGRHHSLVRIQYHPDWLTSNAANVRAAIGSRIEYLMTGCVVQLDERERQELGDLDRWLHGAIHTDRLPRLQRLAEHANRRAALLEQMALTERSRLENMARLQRMAVGLDELLTTGAVQRGRWNLAPAK